MRPKTGRFRTWAWWRSDVSWWHSWFTALTKWQVGESLLIKMWLLDISVNEVFPKKRIRLVVFDLMFVPTRHSTLKPTTILLLRFFSSSATASVHQKPSLYIVPLRKQACPEHPGIANAKNKTHNNCWLSLTGLSSKQAHQEEPHLAGPFGKCHVNYTGSTAQVSCFLINPRLFFWARCHSSCVVGRGGHFLSPSKDPNMPTPTAKKKSQMAKQKKALRCCCCLSFFFGGLSGPVRDLKATMTPWRYFFSPPKNKTVLKTNLLRW